MKKNKYILFTTGRGPAECGLALLGVQRKFKKFLESHSLRYDIVKQQLGSVNGSIETILFKVEYDKNCVVKQWFGTIQWICKSPIRKYSKRKNWYIKCCEIDMPQTISINLKDIVIQAYKASGPGGQHRNKVETAIRIIHQPTGTIVTAADSKSKAQNKKRALVKLEEKLNLLNRTIQSDFELDEWTSKTAVERGNPSKVFYGLKFTEV